MRFGPGVQAGPARVAAAAPPAKAPNPPAPAEFLAGHALLVIDGNKCTGCGICADVCPEHAISIDGIAVVDSGRCTGCGVCIAECPSEALSLGVPTPALARSDTR